MAVDHSASRFDQHCGLPKRREWPRLLRRVSEYSIQEAAAVFEARSVVLEDVVPQTEIDAEQWIQHLFEGPKRVLH